MNTENTSSTNSSINNIQLDLKEENEHLDELRCSTTASNLNRSIENLAPKDILKSELGFICESQWKRKLSAPLSDMVRLNINKLGKGTRGSYYNKLFCKGFFS